MSGDVKDPFADLGQEPVSVVPEDDPFSEEALTKELPVERFIEELERMMLAGHSYTSLRHWAMKEYSVDDAMLTRFQEMIRGTWKIESTTVSQSRVRRDFLRLKYLATYEAAMSCEKFLPAVKALDSIAKMDGLMESDINLTQNNFGENQMIGAHPGQITNATRERIQKLAETMKLRAEQRSIKAAKVISISGDDGKDVG